MIKWAIALGEFDISYQPKPAEKGQAVVDFITDFTYPVDIISTPKEVVSLPSEAQKTEPTTLAWSLYVDGLSNQQGCGAGLVVTTPDKVTIEYVLRFKFKASNNEAEYEAFLAGLRLAKHMGLNELISSMTPNWWLTRSPTTLTLRIAPWQHIWHKHNYCSSTSTTRSPKLLERQTVMQMLWLTSPQRWKTRLGEKFKSNYW
ncbi:hypothetical protein ACFX1W_034508 [Malus domestica]